MDAVIQHPLFPTVAIIWTMFAMGSGLIASEKNRGFWAWVLIGLLLGPIGLLWAITADRVIPPDEARVCPFCGGTINKTATRCSHCRRKVIAEQPDSAAKIGREAAGAVFILRHAMRRAAGAARPPRPAGTRSGGPTGTPSDSPPVTPASGSSPASTGGTPLPKS